MPTGDDTPVDPLGEMPSRAYWVALGFRSFLLPDGLGEDVGGRGFCRPDHVGVDAERDGRVGVAESGGDDVDGDACQERSRGVDVPKVVEPGVRASIPSADRCSGGSWLR